MTRLTTLVEYVFRCWNLRELYLDVPEYDFAQIATGEGRLFEAHIVDAERVG